MESQHTTPHVAIIGGGIGGLGLALALQRSKVPFTVFEADTHFDQRRQGYGFTLQQGSRAIAALGADILDEIRIHDTTSSSHYIFNAHGRVLGFFGRAFCDPYNGLRIISGAEASKAKKYNLHIPRQQLRRILYEKLNDGAVKWSKRLVGIRNHGNDQSMVEFSDGSTSLASIVVGADGIYSQVRRLKCPQSAPLNYLGVVVVLGILKCQHPLLTERVFQTVDRSTRIFVMPFTQDEYMWQLSFPVSDLSEAKKMCASFDLLKHECTLRVSGWHSPIPEFMQQITADSWMGSPVYDRDPEMSFKSNLDLKNSVLIGDAAHAMSPFKGQGANQALLDAMELSHLISSKYPDRLSGEDIITFENQMLKRTHSKVAGSRKASQTIHDPAYMNGIVGAFRGVNDKVLKHLEHLNIGSWSANDGLDELVNEGIRLNTPSS